jgi:hypothetical protein
MNSGLEIGLTLLRIQFRFQIRWLRAARIDIQKYEVAPAPNLPEIRRTLLRGVKSRMRDEVPRREPGFRSCRGTLPCQSMVGLRGDFDRMNRINRI